MSFVTMTGFAFAMLVFALTPGPGVFSVAARALATGFKSTFGLIAGLITGDTIYLMFAVFGLSYVARNMGEVFIIIKFLGSIYLIWIGTKIFFSREEGKGNFSHVKGNYISGLLISLSNPKVIFFYCGFLPNFMDLSVMEKTDILIATIIVITILSVALISYAYLADSAGRMIKNSSYVKMLNRLAGTVMIGSGITIAARS